MDLIQKYLMKDIDVLLNCIDEAILIVDRDANILKYNETFSRLTDLMGRSLVGMNLKDIVASGILRESAALKSLEVKKKIDMNLTYETGQTATWTYIPVFDERGELVMTVGTGRDMTKLVTLEKKLKISETIISQYEGRNLKMAGDAGQVEIIYSSSVMQQVIRLGWKAAATSSPVLIWGETGVGKEIMAALIHQLSARSAKPFVAINCASIPDELLEAELFGYEEGSFTGAKRSGKKGLLEEAHEGTLLLDEIGELPLKMQSKLLRFLQEGNFQKIGSNKTQAVDVRILCATNLTMDQLMNSKQFRQDLFYRIAVIPVFIPPLRDRQEDIPPLILHFIQIFNTKYKTDIKLPAKLMNRLYTYEWPGNVRELKNVIERMAIMHASQELTEEDLELILNINPRQASSDRSLPAPEPAMPVLPPSLPKAMDQFEEKWIRQAYQMTGSIVGAAKLLGINPSTIHRKLKKGILRLD
ncbi:MAG TPA: sigma 54-interacting transcriptional regulator [Smithella sp.]|nr:MAG: Regulatory protein LuxO [Deltaproteobacteria bacterium ADurb.Bin022]HOE31970.1 sigma 54-interacting transcriptional regulator [Smithella sp.]HOE80301.1 sigma 54-interacting transcriptional regulator [Smithellaceae bacterium]HOS14850.1 sigma 54-interacting transcriptional regulator [Smithella sp.]HPC07394.1 sigma 54-interacting transcriptional regulator [Smithella sp.]